MGEVEECGLFNWIRKNRLLILSAIGYTLFAIILMLFFLYLTFPYEKLQKRILALLEEEISLTIKVEEGKFLFPFGVKWDGIHFFHHRSPGMELFTADGIKAELELIPLFKRIVELPLSVHAIGGEFNGRLSIEQREKEIQYLLEGKGSDLDLKRLNLQGMGLKEGIEGILKGEISSGWTGRDFLRGEGFLYFESSDVRLKNIMSPIVGGFTLPEAFFSKITGRINLKDGVGHFDNLLATGPEVEVSGSGNILLKEALPESLINLSFNLHLRGPLAGNLQSKGPLRLSVRGTLRRPLFYINEIPVG